MFSDVLRPGKKCKIVYVPILFVTINVVDNISFGDGAIMLLPFKPMNVEILTFKKIVG